MKKVKLDIGSGRANFEDYITVDFDVSVKAHVFADIELNTAFNNIVNGIHRYLERQGVIVEKENILIEEIRAHHILEHLKPELKVKVMRLFWDLLCEGGKLDVEVPIAGTPQSYQDPTHVSFWNAETFWYFTKGNRFGEAFAKRHSKPAVPLFEKVSDEVKNGWAYQVTFKKVS